MLRFLFLSLVCLLALCQPPSRAGWGGGDCGPVGPITSPLLTPPSLPASWYSWKPIDDDEWALIYNGHQIGGYRASDGVYRPLENEEWGPAGEPPISPPVAPTPRREPPEAPPTGVVTEKVHPGKTSLNGKDVTPDTVRKVILGSGNVPDDSKQLAVTVIGPQDKVKPVLADFESSQALAPYKGKIRLQGYQPDSPFVQCGFVTTGLPTIYIQDAAGKVLHRQDDYVGGPEALAEAIRKADPNYKPQQDPNLHNSIPGTELLQKVPVPLLALAGLAVFLYLTRKE